MVVPIFLAAVVWLSIALWVGVNAESKNRDAWAWFGVTLVFGIFALLVYWATDSPREENQHKKDSSFTLFAGYIAIIVGSIILGSIISIIIATSVERTGRYVDNSQSVTTSIIFNGIFLSISVGFIINILRRHLETGELATFPTDVSLSESRVVGMLCIPPSLIGIIFSYSIISQSHALIQSLIGVLFVVCAISVIGIVLWSLELGRPIDELYEYISKLAG